MHRQGATVTVKSLAALAGSGLFPKADGANIRSRALTHLVHRDTPVIHPAMAAGFEVIHRGGIVVNLVRLVGR